MMPLKDREARKEYDRQYRKRHRERIAEYHKNYSQENKEKLKEYKQSMYKIYRPARYGLTVDSLNMLLEEQEYCCAICKESFKDFRFHIDHCHTTGKVRGLLCQKCNNGLGMFRDNTDYLKKAIGYLNENFSNT